MEHQTVEKTQVLKSIGEERRSAFRKYQDFFVGSTKLWPLFKYELAHTLASPLPGVLGEALRKRLMVSLLRRAGDDIRIGRGVTLRHPGKISIGDRTVIEDECMLDARGTENEEFIIGSDVLIDHGTILASKTAQGVLTIGDNCRIGMGCVFSSSGGIRIGNGVTISDACFIAGGRYGTNRGDIPIRKQEMFTRGPVVIEDDCWIGPGVRVIDGVTIGRGSIIEAGTTVPKDVPPFSTVTSGQQLVEHDRKIESLMGPDGLS